MDTDCNKVQFFPRFRSSMWHCVLGKKKVVSWGMQTVCSLTQWHGVTSQSSGILSNTAVRNSHFAWSLMLLSTTSRESVYVGWRKIST
jgi:hypothetical protein